jgi:glutathione peroxidase
MSKFIIALSLLMAALVAVTACNITAAEQSTKPKEKITMSTATANTKSIHDFTLKNIDGQEVKLDAYKGKVALLVNVASRCGYTPQYEGLQAIYTKYKDQGFVILGFPANNFGSQEPGSNEEIKTFCSTKYNVTFPMFAKISVQGDDIHPLYQFLTSNEAGFGGDVKWNFGKFLVDKNGKVIARFDSGDAPESSKVTQAIEQALQ